MCKECGDSAAVEAVLARALQPKNSRNTDVGLCTFYIDFVIESRLKPALDRLAELDKSTTDTSIVIVIGGGGAAGRQAADEAVLAGGQAQGWRIQLSLHTFGPVGMRQYPEFVVLNGICHQFTYFIRLHTLFQTRLYILGQLA